MIQSIACSIAIVVVVANADTLSVPGDYPTISLAAQSAVPGDVIQVAAGTYFESEISCNGIQVVGATDSKGRPITTVNAQNQGRGILLNGLDPSVSNIKFEQCLGPSIQAGDNATQQMLIENCIFLGSGVSWDDNAVPVNVTIEGCLFTNAYSLGQSNWFYGGSVLDVSNCIFDNSSCRFLTDTVNLTNVTLAGGSELRLQLLGGQSIINDIRTAVGIDGLPVVSELSVEIYYGDMQIDQLTGAFAIRAVRFYGEGSLDLANCLIESSPMAIQTSIPTSLESSFISNNEVGIQNSSTLPITIFDSIICGNEQNISGPYTAENTYVLPNCDSFLGACCINEICNSLVQQDCIDSGGSWRGTNTVCTSSLCAPPDQFGICCINGTAISLFDTDCSKVGGSFFGPGDPEGFACPESCEEDVNSDQNVDYEDLISVISAWGPCAG